MNISSAIVHADPGHAGSVESRLTAIPGVEVHATSGDGRLIVSIESPGDRETADIFEAIQRLDGVLSASLVYAHAEPEPEVEIDTLAHSEP